MPRRPAAYRSGSRHPRTTDTRALVVPLELEPFASASALQASSCAPASVGVFSALSTRSHSARSASAALSRSISPLAIAAWSRAPRAPSASTGDAAQEPAPARAPPTGFVSAASSLVLGALVLRGGVLAAVVLGAVVVLGCVFGAGLRPRRGALVAAADRLHEARALLLEDALHALDGVALAVEQMTDAAQEVDVVRPVIAPPAAALQRPDLREARFPEAQYVLRHVEVLGDLADGPERVRALVHHPSRTAFTRPRRSPRRR